MSTWRRSASGSGARAGIRGRGRIASAVAATLAAVLVAVFAIAPGGDTYAAFSDFGNVNGNSASADVWQANPPAGSSGCGDLSQYTGVIYASSLAGAALEAKAGTILVVDREGVTVTADAKACIVVSVLGVTILDLNTTVHLVLNVAGTVCPVSLVLATLLTLHLISPPSDPDTALCSTVAGLIASLNAILGLGKLHSNAKPAILPGLTDPTTSADKSTPAPDPAPKDSTPTQDTEPTHPSGTTAAPPPAKPTQSSSPATADPSGTAAATQGDAPPATDSTSPSGGQ